MLMLQNSMGMESESEVYHICIQELLGFERRQDLNLYFGYNVRDTFGHTPM